MKNILLVFVLLFTTLLTAQKKTTVPDSQYEVKRTIYESYLTKEGVLVLATKNGVLGLKSNSIEPIFNFTDFGKVLPENLSFVRNTPYLIINKTNEANKMMSKSALINHRTGKTVFNTKVKGWKYVRLDVLMAQNKLVVTGFRDKTGKWKLGTAVYDLTTGEQEGYSRLKLNDFTGSRPFLLKDELILSTHNKLKKVDLINGSELWSLKAKRINNIVTNQAEKGFYGFGVQGVHKFGAGGDLLWDAPFEVGGTVSKIEFLDQGLAIVNQDKKTSKSFGKILGRFIGAPSKKSKIISYISLINTDNGKSLWEKSIMFNGNLQHFYNMEDGILFGSDEGEINIISYEGKPIFEKSLTVGKNILAMTPVPLGLLYISSEETNIVDINSGKGVLEQPLKYPGAKAVSSAFDSKNNRYLINVDKKLYGIDAKTGTVVNLTISNFKGDEIPTAIEVRKEGILLTSSQNMRLLDWDGKEIWHHFYRAGGYKISDIEIAQAVKRAKKVTAVTNRIQNIYSEATKDKKVSNTQSDIASRLFALGKMLGSNNVAERMIRQRDFRSRASSATKNHYYIFTLLDDTNALIKINKDTGEIEKTIFITGLDPEYHVDSESGSLYYKAGKQLIYVYDLKK